MSDDRTNGGDQNGRERRQLALVALCVVAVGVAALVSPAAAYGTNPSGPDFDFSDWFEEDDDEFPPDEGCVVELLGEPVPGTTLTVRVYDDGTPEPGSDVWFNGEYVGETDSRGEVQGEVPFEKQLRVRVDPPDGQACVFREETGTGRALSPDATSGAPSRDAASRATAGTGPTLSADAASGATAAVLAGRTRRQTDPVGTDNNYSVTGEADVRVDGRPVPGSTVTVAGVIERLGFPVSVMPNATVRVDGSVVGRTDRNGTYQLTIPEDGTDRVRVEITRGEFTATRSIRVLALSVGVAPASTLFPLPGGDATVRVRQGQFAVENATVSVGGRTVGRTDARGELGISLPANPLATVAAESDGERAQTVVALVYVRSVVFPLFLLVPLVLTLGLGYRMAGLRGVGYAVAGWVGIGVVAVATRLWGRNGFLVSAGTITALVVLAVLVRRRTAVATGGATLADQLRAFVGWLLGMVMSVTLRLEALARFLGRTLSELESVRDLLARLGAGLRSAPGRLWRFVARSRTVKVVLGLGLWAVLVGVAFVLAGPEGALLALGVGPLVALVLAFRWWSARESPAGEQSAAGRSAGESAERVTDPRWLRRAWRRLARWLFPGRWQTKTPGEVSRAAVERGLPARPVEQLTETFRDVEYGGQSLSEARREVVTTAVEVIEARRSAEEDDQ